MKDAILYKNKNEYSSFPLLTKMKDKIQIGFFIAPVPDHMGIFNWKIMQSIDQGETWGSCHIINLEKNPRAISDCVGYQLNGNIMVTGSYGFLVWKNYKTTLRSKGLFIKTFDNNLKLANYRLYKIPTADIVLTFPRPLVPKKASDFFTTLDELIRLVPAYIILKNGINRALAWRSGDSGRTWRLYNMFPSEVNVNEMAFIWTDNGILAHLRSDKHPYIMESWSGDGITWTYPTNIFAKDKNQGKNIIGGPPHLLRLNDNKILCTYGYRQTDGMGIRAVVSDDEGDTWSKPIILREDSGYCSSLRKRKLRNRFRLPHPGNDCGYPVSIQLDNNEILTAYYITCKDQITGIEITKWEIE